MKKSLSITLQYLLIMALWLSITGCDEPSVEEVMLATPVIELTATGPVLSVSLVDSLPAAVKTSIHEGLMGTAVFEVWVTENQKTSLLTAVTQIVTYDLWNQNYHIFKTENQKIETAYIPTPVNLAAHFAILQQVPLPLANINNKTISVQLTLEVDQITDSEQIDNWSRDLSLARQIPEDNFDFGLDRLVSAFIADGALLAYQSSLTIAEVQKGRSSGSGQGSRNSR